MINTLCKDRLKPKSVKHYVAMPLLILWTATSLVVASPKPITNYLKRTNENEGVVTDGPASANQGQLATSWSWNTRKDNTGAASEAQSWNFDPRKDDILNWENKLGTDDRHVDMATSIVEVIVYIVIALVILSFISFLVCICCPICVFAKIRHRRRGHVYARQTGISTVATTVTLPQAPQGIAIPNQRFTAPYPVQETVTVIPLVPPQALPYSTPGLNCQELRNFGQKPPSYDPLHHHGMTPINSTEPPPPYPGLPSQGPPELLQQPYNPYFNGETTPNPSSTK